MKRSDRLGDIRLSQDIRIPYWEGSTSGLPLKVGAPLMMAVLAWLLVEDGHSIEMVLYELAALSSIPIALAVFARHKSLVLRSDGSAEIPTEGRSTLVARRADVVAQARGPDGVVVLIGKDRLPLACLWPNRYVEPETSARWLDQHYGHVRTVPFDPQALDMFLRRQRTEILRGSLGSPPFKRVLLVLLALLGLVLYYALKSAGRI